MPFFRTAIRLIVGFCLTALLFGSISTAWAQLPATRLDSVFPLCANPGKTIEMTIAGADLDDVQSLQFSHAGITAKQKLAEPGPFDEGPQPVSNQFIVAVAGNVPLGRYELRAMGKYGVSNPRTFFVTSLSCATEVEPNQSADAATEIELPADVSGQLLSAADTDYYRFTAKASERIILDCYARRADSQADAVVAAYDATGRELDSSRDGNGGDPLLDFNVTAGQTYTIKVHDAVFRGGAAYAYHFTAGALPHVDFLFPPAALPGTRPFTVFGRNLPGGQNAGLSIDGKPIQKIAASIPLPVTPTNISAFIDPASGGLNAVAYRAQNTLGWSNPVLAGVATAPPLTETEPNNSPRQSQKLTIPCEVMGRCDSQRDSDWFSFEAKKDELLTVEVISHRMGLETDPALLIQQITKPAEGEQPEQLKQLAFVTDSNIPGSGPEFDAYSRDPIQHFAVPADGTYRVMVRDRRNALRADPRQIYRLAIRKAKPDFQLVAIPDGSYSAVLLRKGGQAGIRVVAFRQDGFDGEIKLSATGMPAGVTSGEVVIGPETNSATLVLVAAANAAPATATIQVAGTSQVGTANAQRIAQFAAAIDPLPPRANATQPQLPTDARLTDRIILSVSGEEAAPVSIQAGGGKVWETSRAGILKIPYARAGAFKGKLTLVPDVLPANVEAPVLTINPNANAGEYQIKLKNNTPTGTYSFVLAGIAEQHDYSRNPEAAKVAAEKKQKVDKIAAEAAVAAKAATDAQTAANKAATDAASAVQNAMTMKTQADQVLAQANQLLASTTNSFHQAKAAAAGNPQDTNLATAAANLQKALTDAAAKVTSATDAVAAAQKALDDASAKSKTATDAKMEADKKAAEATERAKLATELKTKTDKLVTDLANAAKPKKINFPVVSTPVTLKITPAPITLAIANPSVALMQGEKAELPVAIQRLYGFTPAVTLGVVLPSGLGGLSIPNAQIPANQTQGKLAITAAANATVGSHAVTVRATMNLNGQNLTVDQLINLNLREVPKTK